MFKPIFYYLSHSNLQSIFIIYLTHYFIDIPNKENGGAAYR